MWKMYRLERIKIYVLHTASFVTQEAWCTFTGMVIFKVFCIHMS